MATKKKKHTRASLAAGRPPLLQRPKSISRKATKALINKHHLLEKQKEQATKQGDDAKAASLRDEIDALGGIERYQQASLQGQRDDRGGDSSRVLMEWLKHFEGPLKDTAEQHPRMLEVGALSTNNACSRSGIFDLERIDLNSQEEGILQQDFMKRPLPKSDNELFDIISLSLVLNFVPDPMGRGDMLLRTLEFLKQSTKGSQAERRACFPSLFLVLPAPCVTNSRYLDEERLGAIMASLGYTKIEAKITQRLVYYLWRRDQVLSNAQQAFAKKEVRSGRSRNNFAIVLKDRLG